MTEHLSKILREVIEFADDNEIELVRFPDPHNVTEEEADTLIAFGSCLASFHYQVAPAQRIRSFIDKHLVARIIVDTFISETAEHRYYCRGLGWHFALRENEECVVEREARDEEKTVATAKMGNPFNELSLIHI